ncbi:MAG: hypothetical protein N2045_13830 [Fimbriimonadales bacterium]|nr:hypothetical protein [Fimbriimonadales bacterium]
METRTVRFEPNFYSFDEIAQRLSTETFQVRCSSRRTALAQGIEFCVLCLERYAWRTAPFGVLKRGLPHSTQGVSAGNDSHSTLNTIRFAV